MSNIKYFSSYSGPSYGLLDQTHMDGHTSLYEAMQAMRARQSGYDYPRSFKEDAYGVHHLEGDGSREYTLFPATSNEDVMWVYWAIPDFEDYTVLDKDGNEVHKRRRSGGYTIGDLAYCITVGARGGVRSEKA